MIKTTGLYVICYTISYKPGLISAEPHEKIYYAVDRMESELVLILLLPLLAYADLNVGVGIADATGPIAEVPFVSIYPPRNLFNMILL